MRIRGESDPPSPHNDKKKLPQKSSWNVLKRSSICAKPANQREYMPDVAQGITEQCDASIKTRLQSMVVVFCIASPISSHERLSHS